MLRDTARYQVLTMLRDRGPMSRMSLATRTALSTTSTSRVVNQLIDEDILEESPVGATTPRRGRPPVAVSLRPDAARVIGVQIGVGIARMGVVDVTGSVSSVQRMSFDPGLGAQETFAAVGERVQRMMQADRSLKPAGVGIAVPGPVDADYRRLLFPSRLPWRDVPVADMVESMLGIPTTIDHNVKTMALAEYRYGRAKGEATVAYVYLRTGIGAGLVVEGSSFEGGVRGAIELEHVRAAEDGPVCVCGNRGCLGTFVAGPALNDIVARLGLRPNENPLSAIHAAAASSDLARAALDEVVGKIATSLSTLVTMLNPSSLLLGGYLATAPASFLDELRAATRDGIFPLLKEGVRIEKSRLGIDAGVPGGGAIALDRFFFDVAR